LMSRPKRQYRVMIVLVKTKNLLSTISWAFLFSLEEICIRAKNRWNAMFRMQAVLIQLNDFAKTCAPLSTAHVRKSRRDWWTILFMMILRYAHSYFLVSLTLVRQRHDGEWGAKD
jgi:hypothetical protein